MYANYHTHTFRCKHATGVEEEYILTAIEGGIKIMGFSDHAPAILYDGYKLSWRVQPEDAEDYFETLKNLREKYKDKIKIYIGFEMEYYPEHFEKMYSYVKNLGAEYLILGQHFYDELGGIPHSAMAGHSDEHLINYTNSVIAGMKTGKFLYVAHPDMLNHSGDKMIYEREARRLCEASKKFDVPLEINLLGVFDGRHYPNEAFFEIVAEENCPVILGMDAHAPKHILDTHFEEKALEMVHGLGLTLLDTVELRPL